MDCTPRPGWLARLLVLCWSACLSCAALAENAVDDVAEPKPFIVVADAVPPGFDDFLEKQTTQADIYYGGLFLTHAFVEFDPNEVEILDPLSVINAIPNVRDPMRLAELLGGPRPTNAHLLCNARVRTGCGRVDTSSVDLIFDGSNFRLDLFVGADELLLHSLAQQKYLPDATVERSLLHNVRMSLSGVGSERRYNLGSESFFSLEDSRFRARYAVSDEGFSLYEASWQQDDKDVEYEVGSFRTLGRNIAFTNDLDVVGVRMATSTKRRIDLDQALGTPVQLFLVERSRVDVYRGSELIHSRYYDAGNQQIDTSGFPDGAYDVALKITSHSGTQSEQTQFFVRSGMMPPKDEPQYYIEAGTIVDTNDPGVPEFLDEVWLRAGGSHRLRDNLSIDNEMLYAGRKGLLQSGAFVLQENWHLYTGAMLSSNADLGFSIRGGFHFGTVSATLDYRQVDVRNPSASSRSTDGASHSLNHQAFDILPTSYKQGTASLAFPLWKGRFFLRGRLNQRAQYEEKSIGFSYWAPLFAFGNVTGNLSIDGNFARGQSWVQAGVQIRWQRARESVVFNPRGRFSDNETQGQNFDMLANGRWNGASQLPLVGAVDRSVSLDHDQTRSRFGVRMIPRDNPMSDVEVGMQRSDARSDVYYAMNNRFSLVSAGGNTTLGDGGNSAGAVVINVLGDISAKFEVLVDDRVVGYVWAGTPNVISLRPYESYAVKIRPVGAKLVGFDERVQTITLYPGNVETLDFVVRELTVLVGQAVYPDGRAVAQQRFQNVEGYGSTDAQGWFQVEISHREPLLLGAAEGPQCQLALPPLQVEQGLAVVDSLVCEPIQAQP